MKEVYSYQEIGTLIDEGKQVVFSCFPEVRVCASKKKPESDAISATFVATIGDTCIGTMESEYASIETLLEAFYIDDLEEVFELTGQG